MEDQTLVVDRYTLQEINKSVDPARYVKIIEPGAPNFSTNEIVKSCTYNEAVRSSRTNGETLLTDWRAAAGHGPVDVSAP